MYNYVKYYICYLLHFRSSYRLHDVLAILEADPDAIPVTGIDIILLPPVNACEDLTDEDSADEDAGDIENLPASQLLADAELSQNFQITSTVEENNQNTSASADSDEKEAKQTHKPAKKKQRVELKWKKIELNAETIEWPQVHIVSNNLNPVGLFNPFTTDDIVNLIVNNTNAYAQSKNEVGDITPDEI